MPAIVRVSSMRDRPFSPNAVIINTTSSALTSWETDLSPFFLGPCELYDGRTAKKFENLWQFAKVYKKHADADGSPTADYWTWAEAGWADERAHRYPMGRGAKPLYSLWKGEKLGYIQARKQIYAPLYAAAVRKTAGFAQLTKLYNESKELILRDYDGYDHLLLGVSLSNVLNNPNRKMGHAFVLAALLTNDPSMQEWRVV